MYAHVYPADYDVGRKAGAGPKEDQAAMCEGRDSSPEARALVRVRNQQKTDHRPYEKKKRW